MRRPAMIVVAAGAMLVAGLALALRPGRIPLGVPGEWEWQRVRPGPSAGPIAFALAGVAAYAGFAAAGFRAMAREGGRRRRSAWLAGLVVAAVAVQGVVQEGAPPGYGLSKWIFALHPSGSSGYYTVARWQMGDARKFLADYPTWIQKQDALHVGTHPPGLFLTARALLVAMGANPRAARAVVDASPPSVITAILALRDTDGLTRADAAALSLTGALTLLACASTVVPLYFLARSSLPPASAWASAALWPLVPSAILFQPTADTAFPLLATSALALAVRARRPPGGSGPVLAFGSGLVMAAGMVFTLAFLAVGLVAALILATPPGPAPRRRAALIASTGAGFLAGALGWWAATSSDPFSTWWANQANHARFYAEYPRSYRAWIVANPVELAVAIGLPATAWALAALGSPRRVPREAWATLFVLAALTLTGRSLSEVARLWLPLMPPLLVASGAGFGKLGGGAWSLAITTALMGAQALILEATIQVVYPV